MDKVRFRRGWRLLAAMLAVFALIAAACGGDDDTESSGSDDSATEEGGDDTATDEETPAEEETPADEETPAEEETPTEDGGEGGDAEGLFQSQPAASGDAIAIGYVNTEGPAGLNFPELEDATAASVDYINDHGGMGGRPIQLEVCIADGSPESSQACAQELAGKDVEMVWLGLDLFPDYATYDAAGIPVVGIIPLFPADYASDAIFFSGGNATLAAGNAYVAVEHFGATKVAIISADNVGANSSEAAVIAALEKAGVEYRSIKGAESETDAGAQGLVQEALSDDPDLLISLYGDAGCIGMMRGRAALGSDIPVLASSTCSNAEVLEAVGDDAIGWIFLPAGTRPDTPDILALKEAIAPLLEVENPADVVVSDLGLGAVAPTLAFTVAAAAIDLAAGGGEVTGAAVAEHIKANPEGTLRLFPEGAPLTCGAAEAYVSVCALELFAGEYTGEGEIAFVPGLESFDVTDYLP